MLFPSLSLPPVAAATGLGGGEGCQPNDVVDIPALYKLGKILSKKTLKKLMPIVSIENAEIPGTENIILNDFFFYGTG